MKGIFALQKEFPGITSTRVTLVEIFDCLTAKWKIILEKNADLKYSEYRGNSKM